MTPSPAPPGKNNHTEVTVAVPNVAAGALDADDRSDRRHLHSAPADVDRSPTLIPSTPRSRDDLLGALDGARVDEAGLVASVVVAVRGNARDLAGLLAALSRQDLGTGLFELIVVDNHPSAVVEPTVFAAAGFAWQLVHEPVAGVSRARNAGIRRARGACVLITDPDSRPGSSWVRELATALIDQAAAVAGGPAIPRLPMEAALRSQLRQWFVPPVWPEHTQELTPPYWIVGCNMGFRRTSPPPMFDENLGAVGRRHRSCEDLELVIRAQMAGQRVLLVPAAVVHRTVTADDLRLRALLSRAFWHGVSVAQLRRNVPARYIVDSYRLRDVITERHHLTRLTHLARLAGYCGARLAAKLRTHQRGVRATQAVAQPPR
ncbi:glycosyltransferase [Dactylosporangium salmoneum]|uniref:4,4'-diaponeurosporenoate glycosyltransferase n=1 Tax=Dactylosporangium salmoneum TaxID=53361 RepID=A0ABP5SUC7_9ACTN